MASPDHTPTRRLAITLRRGPWLLMRPTIVISGRGQPTQWGAGTWQVSADEPAEVTVFLHARGLTWGRATCVVEPEDEPVLEYQPPWLLLLPGRFVRNGSARRGSGRTPG